MSVEVVGGWAAWRFVKKTYKSLAEILARLAKIERRTKKIEGDLKALGDRVEVLEDENARHKSEKHGLKVKVGRRDAIIKRQQERGRDGRHLN